MSRRPISLPPTTNRGYTLDAWMEGDRAHVVLGGNVGLDNSEDAGRAIETLRKELVHARVKEATLDLRTLYFLASSGLKLLVAWVTASEHRYPITILTDPNLHWQRRSLSALASLEPDYVRLVEKEAP